MVRRSDSSTVDQVTVILSCDDLLHWQPPYGICNWFRLRFSIITVTIIAALLCVLEESFGAKHTWSHLLLASYSARMYE
jgi:hypothetical protein